MLLIELNGLTFLIAALAVYRIAILIATEEGPFSVFEKLRAWAERLPLANNWIARGLACPLCISFWAGFVASVVFYQSLPQYILTALALSAVTVVIHKFLG